MQFTKKAIVFINFHKFFSNIYFKAITKKGKVKKFPKNKINLSNINKLKFCKLSLPQKYKHKRKIYANSLEEVIA